MGSHGSHEFDAAAGSGKRQGPEGILPGQTYDAAQLSGEKSLARMPLGHIDDTDIFIDISLDGMYIEPYRTCHILKI
jgi:hypothetical protein